MLITSALVLACAFVLGNAFPQASKRSLEGSKPHVFFFLIDDMGFNDIFWNNDEIIMPFAKSLTDDGKILNQFYSNHVCSPSRGTLMSGLAAHKIGMTHTVFQGAHPECLKTDVDLLPKRLKKAGYATHMVGKWHLGFCAKECTPTGRGFDTFYGYYHGASDHYERTASAEPADLNRYDFHDEVAGDDSSYGADEGIARNHKLYTSDIITDRVVDIIGKADPNEPMFVYFASPLVHTPMKVPQKYLDNVPESVGDENRRIFTAMTQVLDESIEKVVNKLKEVGMYDKTVIIFQSDNGGEPGHGSNLPLRGAKATLFEGGIRVPAFVHSALMDDSEKGTVSEGMHYVADWSATILELAGLTEDIEELDGFGQVDFLFHGGETKRTEFIPSLDVYFPQLYGHGTIRSGDYKLIVGWPGIFDGFEANGTLTFANKYDYYGVRKLADASLPQQIVKRGEYDFDWAGLISYLSEVAYKEQLYNIKKDPLELNDLAQVETDKVNELKAKINEAKDDFFKFNLGSAVNEPAGLPKNHDETWVTGWCKNGPVTMDV